MLFEPFRSFVIAAWVLGRSPRVKCDRRVRDPVDMGADEARAFANKILLAATAAD